MQQTLHRCRSVMHRTHILLVIVSAVCHVIVRAKSSTAASALQPNISSAAVLARLTAQPKFSQQFKQLPNYRAAVDLHLMLHDMLGQQLPLRAAPTKVSDAQGVLLLTAAAGELKGWPLMVQVSSSSSSSHCGGLDCVCMCRLWLLRSVHLHGCATRISHHCWPRRLAYVDVLTMSAMIVL
jgi:hypothetical protein